MVINFQLNMCISNLTVRDIKLFMVCSSLAYTCTIKCSKTSLFEVCDGSSVLCLFSGSEFHSKSNNFAPCGHNFPIAICACVQIQKLWCFLAKLSCASTLHTRSIHQHSFSLVEVDNLKRSLIHCTF